MKANNIVKSIMATKGITQEMLTKMIGMKRQSAVSGALNRNMKISTLTRFVTILGCELVIRDGEKEYKIEE